MLSTSDTLLDRVTRQDSSAWRRLCDLYGPIIYGWCRRSGLADSDAADLVQEVFITVYNKIHQFHRSKETGTFHGWLWAITLNCIRMRKRSEQHLPRAADVAVEQFADDHEPFPNSDVIVDQARNRVVRRALELIRTDFEERTWEAFTRTTLGNETYQEVAVDLNMKPNAVKQARYRVLKRLRQELDGLV